MKQFNLNLIIKKYLILIIALLLLWSTTLIILLTSCNMNEGHFIYALDDSYIHMAMAKNFSQYGIWGITSEGFTSSTSSPLWTLLLSIVYFLFGVNDAAPFILNIIFASILIFIVFRILLKYQHNTFLNLTSLTAIIIFTPLVTLIFSGMEHILHIIFTILTVYLSVRVLLDDNKDPKCFILLIMVSILLLLTRYEGLFLILMVFILLIVRKFYLKSILFFVTSLSGIALYGLISVSKGWLFLPNSILLKGNAPKVSTLNELLNYLNTSILQLRYNQEVLALMLISLIIFIALLLFRKNFWRAENIGVFIFIAITFLHMQFAGKVWFYRYEAYLIALGIFVIVPAANKLYLSLSAHTPKFKVLIVFVFVAVFSFFCAPLIPRAIDSIKDTPVAAKNIYQQQYQMGLFIKQFYSGSCVALNDIGAVNYMADIKTVDLAGLANMEVARQRLKNGNILNSKHLMDVSFNNGVELSLVYDSWFSGAIPDEWIKVAEWKISDNVVCGSDRVSFYVINSDQKPILYNNLLLFSDQLPQGVDLSYEY